MKQPVLVISALGSPPYIGGIETVIDTLLNSILRESYTFFIFDTYRAPDPERRLPAKALYALCLPFRCAKYIYKIKPQVTHIHFCARTDFWKHSLCLFASKAMGVKVIFHLHGGIFDTFYNQSHPLKQAAIRFVLKRADILIALSQYWYDFLSRLVHKSVNIRILPNPIDCATLCTFSGENSISNHSVVLLGSLGKRKGHYDVLKAAQLVLARNKDTDFYFAGRDEDYNARKQLEKLVKEKNLIDNIHFLGPVSGTEKLKLLGEASIIILPSYGENMPISVLEGMAAGKPVIATRVGAVPEVITDSKNGLLIEPGDWRALGEKINFIFDNPARAMSMGKQAQKTVQKNWDVSIIAAKVDSLYQEVL